ncbi:MAG: hypothetical protein ACWGSQ_05195 [Longimicrobiales bacterium]
MIDGREELLERLAEAAERIPGDLWILGQRIRYLGDVGRWEEAQQIAEECTGGEPWWCPALKGYVLHRSGRVQDAAVAFGVALGRMEEKEAAEWWDPSILVEYPVSRWIKDPEGIPQAEALSRFWRLADPLLLTPGNERLTEHFARRFGASLYAHATITLGVPWGSSLEQLLLRYGFTAGWERSWPEMNGVSEGAVVEHHHPEIRGLLPPLEALENPAGVPQWVWTPEDDRPRSASAPVLAPLVVDGLAQTAVLRRGADLLVVAAYSIPSDTLLQRRRPPGGDLLGDPAPAFWPAPWEPSGEGASPDTLSGLFLLAENGDRAPLSALAHGSEGILQVRAPAGGYLLSVELWNPVGRWASRVRHGIMTEAVPPDVPTLSDLLLLRRGSDLPENLPQALPRMRTSADLPGKEPLTVGWEVYGLGRRQEPLTFRLDLRAEEGSFIRRALKRIGLFNRAPALSLSWREAGTEESGPLFRAVDVDLPPLEPGRYVLTLEMSIPNRSKVAAHRRIRVH